MENVHAIEFKNITKRFGSVVANNHVDLYVDHGVVMAILGENGSGKTSLMNMVAGIYYPDEGEIFVEGKKVTIKTPKDAFAVGVGMIHQHFKLIDVFTAAQNVILGLEEEKMDLKAVSKKVKEIADKYGFEIDPDKKVYEMSVSEKQTVEIIKVLYRGADILILDEPTAVLTPQETEKLFNVLRSMREAGKTVIIITHKLNEVMEISDVVAVMRKGEHIKTVRTVNTNPDELTEMMVGHSITLDIKRVEPKNPKPRITVADLEVKDKEGNARLKNVGFIAYGGEILGVAGIAGSGQKELLETIAGLRRVSSGSIIYSPEGKTTSNLVGKSPMEIREAGIAMAFVPEDRLGMGLVGGMGMTENMMVRTWYNDGIFVNREKPKELALEVLKDLEVNTLSVDYPVRKLSGGNVQKVLVGREIATHPSVLMSAYAVRGLDINTSYTIYNLLSEQKEQGVAVIYVGEDLDVLVQLCDRIMVLNDGQVAGIVDARTTTKEEIGLLMTKKMKEEE